MTLPGVADPANAGSRADPGGKAGAVERDAGSFRDPSGFIFWQDGQPYRQIQQRFAAEWDAFEASSLKRRLTEAGLLIPYEPVPIGRAQGPDAHAVIRPERIEFISYPYEWTFGELRDAALLTLDAQLEAMAEGWQLKDASAYNVQFRDARPILIDSLSFEPLEEGAPWVAYRQFCEHFLAPLALIARRDVRLASLLRVDPDGIPLDLASSLLPWRTRLDFGLLSHVHLHARAQRRYAGNESEVEVDAARGARISRQRLEGLIKNLRGTVERLRWEPAGTEWSDYADHTSYGDAATADKSRLVEAFVNEAQGSRLWDLGANTGRYSRIAADAGKRVIAFDIDPAAAERDYRQVRHEGRGDILPLILDVANPSPGIGWAGRERRSLLERADPDIVLALALVHHVAISRNVPLPMVLGLFADLARYAIVEFVPKEDSQVRRLLARRPDIFPDYAVAGFESAFAARFALLRREEIPGTERTLYLMRRKKAVL